MSANCYADDRFPEVHAGLAKLAGQVVEMIEASGGSITEESAIHGTYRRACELRKPPTVAKTRALLLGDSGVGKSSLINALLGMPGLAKVVALGTSVTTVATSYESPLQGQTKKFGIQIDYLSEHEVPCLIRVNNDYKVSTDNSAEFEPEDLNHIEKAGTTAFEALSHLFYGDVDLRVRMPYRDSW
ncbi:hypothetical protein EJ03DRAFT_355193 [Teratosphaeria nubilosa]|uniref:Uncharacterized protein n=1 Tax=Teratosphaeria nubilosa TaxID=161662 RepID=A0A6G1KYI9_9PEZI|nr:hypothetical protein EJ03DRAFT_355193 [Teratosphaeria nubilosa]